MCVDRYFGAVQGCFWVGQWFLLNWSDDRKSRQTTKLAKCQAKKIICQQNNAIDHIGVVFFDFLFSLNNHFICRRIKNENYWRLN